MSEIDEDLKQRPDMPALFKPQTKRNNRKGKSKKKAKAKRPRGRPKHDPPQDPKNKITESKYDPNIHPKQLIEICDQGGDLLCAAGDFGISESTIHDWIKRYPEMQLAAAIGKAKSYAWWQRKGQTGMDYGKDFNATVWVFARKNMHGWKDKHEVSGNRENPLFPGNTHNNTLVAILADLEKMSPEQIDARIQSIVAKRRLSKGDTGDAKG